jgi:hypothetical protein
MSQSLAQPENEFSDVAAAAAAAGVDAPAVVRRWVNISTGGHLSGVTWGTGPAEVVLVAAPDSEARALDEVVLRLARPAVALDLPGTGRSSDPPTTARRAGRALAEAIASFAPKATTWVGFGGPAVLSGLARAGRKPTRVLLVDPVLAEDEWPLLADAAVPVTVLGTPPAQLAERAPHVTVTDSDLSDLLAPAHH